MYEKSELQRALPRPASRISLTLQELLPTIFWFKALSDFFSRSTAQSWASAEPFHILHEEGAVGCAGCAGCAGIDSRASFLIKLQPRAMNKHVRCA